MVVASVIASALLQAAAFLFPPYFFWGSLVSLIPLFTLPTKLHSPARMGFTWGIIFFGSLYIGLLPFLHTFAQGNLKFVPYGLIVLYFSSLAAAWFWLAIRWGWIPATMLYTTFLYYGSLIPFGQRNGIPLANMLVPLAEYPFLVLGTRYIGILGFTWLLIGLQYLTSRHNLCVLGIILCLAGGLVTETPPAHIAQVAYLAPQPGEQQFPADAAQYIADKISQRSPKSKLILLPEGAMRCALNTVSARHIIAEATEECEVVLGSHRVSNGAYFNCAYHISRRSMVPFYDKTHCVPFAEYVPAPWAWSSTLSSLILQGHESLQPSPVGCQAYHLPIGPVIPQICYDLYFRSDEPAGHLSKDVPILCLTNDRWYPAYLQRLLLLLARLRAISWGRDIWYIAHTGGWWLGKWGGLVILPSL